jgi:regulator of sirC expression with transglutaminase-like and TPR domain
VRQQADALAAAATALEGELMQPRNQADQDTENFPSKLDNQLAYVYWKLAEPDAAPTAGQAERIADLLREKDVLLGRVRELVDREVAAFNDLARRRGAAPITVAAPRPRPGE